MVKPTRRDFLKITAVSAGALAGLWRVLQRPMMKVEDRRLLMGTLIHITLISPDETEALAALEATYAEMERLIAIFNHRDPDSELAVLNRAGYLNHPSTELTHLTREALGYSESSGGSFDISVKPLLNALSAGRVPDDAVLTLTNYRNISVDDARIAFGRPEMQVTFDGIAKGHIVDAGLDVLRSTGYPNGIVEAGGDLMVSGSQSDGEAWRVGIGHPRQSLVEGFLTNFPLHRGAVATSGDYMNSFSEDFLSHHIIDPRTGASPPELSSVTVIAPSATQADALSTTLMVMGSQSGLGLVNSLEGIEALVVTKDLRVLRTSGFPSQA